MKNGHEKMIFPLEDLVESIWVTKSGSDYYIVDNIPFFAHEVSLGDYVFGELNDLNQLVFSGMKKKSGNSTYRIYVFDGIDSIDRKFFKALKKLGCVTEGNGKSLLAINLPNGDDYSILIELLKSGMEDGKWEYEEADIQSL